MLRLYHNYTLLGHRHNIPLGGRMQSGAITKRRGVQLPFGPWHFTAMANISLSCVSVSATPTVRTNSDGGGRKEGSMHVSATLVRWAAGLKNRRGSATFRAYLEGIRLAEKGHILEITNGWPLRRGREGVAPLEGRISTPSTWALVSSYCCHADTVETA